MHQKTLRHRLVLSVLALTLNAQAQPNALMTYLTLLNTL
jgi:hypothetical protein